MKLTLKPHHLKRYKDIALLFWKYGTSDLAKEFADETTTSDEKAQLDGKGRPTRRLMRPGRRSRKNGADVRQDSGQLLASRADLLPEPYLKALARLQDKVKPFPYEQVEEIIVAELGVRMSKAFFLL